MTEATILDFNDAAPLQVIDPADWERRLSTLRDTLASRAREMVAEVFPRARINGNDARVGNVDGEPGESLSINLTTGQWFDHADANSKGDLIDLWQATGGARDFYKAVEELEVWAGLSRQPKWRSPVRAVAEARAAEARANPAPPRDHGTLAGSWAYLSADGQLLATIKRFDLDGTDERTGKRKKTFRPFLPNGAMGMPDPRPLYRLPSIKTASVVVLVEGEKAAEALASVGIEATTQMGGASADPAKTDWTALAGKKVLIWQDNDEAGQGLAARVTPSLETLGCRVSVVPIPKDRPRTWDAADAVAAGEDVAAMLAEPTKAFVDVFRIFSIADLASLKPPEWRIGGVFPVYGASTIYGAYESYKTFVALDMLLSLAAGRDWFGYEIKPCEVLYIVGEGQFGVAQRILGWCQAKNEGQWPTGFRVLPEAVAIPTAGSLDKLLRSIDTLPEAPGVVAMDTVTRMSGGGSLNDEKDVQAYVMGMDRLRLHTGGHIMNIGHSGKDKDKGLLGSIVLPAAMETIICVERSGDSLTLVNKNPKGKQKDGPNFEDIRLRTQLVKFEQAGAESSTLILMPDDEVVQPNNGEAVMPLGKLERDILTALGQAAGHGQSLRFTRLSAMCGNPRSSSLSRSLNSLIGKGLIQKVDDDYLLP